MQNYYPPHKKKEKFQVRLISQLKTGEMCTFRPLIKFNYCPLELAAFPGGRGVIDLN